MYIYGVKTRYHLMSNLQGLRVILCFLEQVGFQQGFEGIDDVTPN